LKIMQHFSKPAGQSIFNVNSVIVV